MSTLEIKNLHANVLPTEEGQEAKPILKGVNLTINGGETHAIMGPNAVSYTHLTLPTNREV